MSLAADIIRGLGDARHGIVYRAPRRKRRPAVALTFDDGPSTWTPTMLDALEAGDGRGTFFVLGSRIAGREATLRRARDAGHELACHGWGHDDPATLDDAALRADLDRGRTALSAVTGEAPRLYRPPYAHRDHRVADVARSAGFERVVLLTCAPRDWAGITAEEIAEHILQSVGPGDIVCLHDGTPPRNPRPDATCEPTAAALSVVVPELRQRGLELVTVSKLLA